MLLKRFSLDGYRRFDEAQFLNIDCKQTALLGPNEAGKTSLLNALHSFNENGKIQRSGSAQDVTRKRNVQDTHRLLSARFLLEKSDIAAMRDIPGAEQIRWATLHRLANGQLEWEFSPAPTRSTGRRKHILSYYRSLALLDLGAIDNRISKHVIPVIKELDAVLPDDTAEILGKDSLAALRTLLEAVRSSGDQTSAEELSKLIADEEKPHPSRLAEKTLRGRLPIFLKFENEDRDLKPEYNLTTFYGPKNTAPIPKSLNNLITAANLDLRELYQAATTDDRGTIRTLLNAANQQLRTIVSTAWKQSNILVYFDLDGTRLSILAESNEISERISERSEGLRQFIALCAFLSQTSTNGRAIILLVDEAEQHLHYDAQADLIRMLNKQKLASQVIYTTHSFGCLPEDLGLGMKFVQPAEGKNTSQIENKSWVNGKIGLSPILFRMGAATMAFLPIRCCLMVEGAVDMLLLPPLFRNAIGKENVGFQIAPGLSECSTEQISIIKNDGSRIAFLVDGDKAGDEIRKKLEKAGISEKLIFNLCAPNNQMCVAEDFLDKSLYVEAINQEIQLWQKTDKTITTADLADTMRPTSLKSWCDVNGVIVPEKVNIAYRILDKIQESPFILENSRRQYLAELHKAVESLFMK